MSNQQMGDVVGTGQKLGIVIRLIKGAENAAVISYEIFVGINQVRPGPVQLFNDMVKSIWSQFVVIVQEGKVLTDRQLYSSPGCLGYSAIFLEVNDLDPLVFIFPIPQQRANMRISTAIVGEAQFPVGVCLIQYRTDTVVEEMGINIVHGNNH